MQDLKVCAVQYDIAWKQKSKNFEKLDKMLSNVEADVFILPEMYSTGFCFDVEELKEPAENSISLRYMMGKAAEKNAAFCGSIMIEENEQVFNRLYWVSADGTYASYDKAHLFSMSEEPANFSAGNSRLTIELGEWTIAPFVCYDLRFPVWCRNNAEAPYDLAIFIANWPEKRSYQWEQLLIARAIENQSYVIGVNRVGDDGNDIAHDGRTLLSNALGVKEFYSTNQELALTETLSKEHLKKTKRYMPFLKDADDFELR